MKKLLTALVAVTLTTISLTAAPALAGSYNVYACAGAAGGAQRAFVPVADSMMSAYSICPTNGQIATGVATKVTSNGGVAPSGAGAYQVFEAPRGTSLAGATMSIAELRMEKYWNIGVVGYDGALSEEGDMRFGCRAWGPGCDIATPNFYGPVSIDLGGHSKFRIETRCYNASGCGASSTGKNPANRALFSATNIVVQVRDDHGPAIGDLGSAWWNRWHRRTERFRFSSYDASGNRFNRIYLDGTVMHEDDFSADKWHQYRLGCDFTLPKPCRDNPSAYIDLDTLGVGDGKHRLRLEAIDAAGNDGALEQDIYVDNTAPEEPSAPSVTGGEGWRRTNAFSVAWTSPQGQVSPVARAHYRICPAAPGGCAEGEQSGESIDHLTDLAVPGPGDYSLRVWLEDDAGNVDPERAGDAVHLRFDDRAPDGAFEASGSDDPLTVRARVHDGESGVAHATIELRPIGGHAWHELDTAFDSASASARIDDLALEDGAYDLRLLLADHAGNEATVNTRADGSPMRLQLPLRAAARIGVEATAQSRSPRCRRVGRARKHRKRRKRCRARGAATVAVDGRAELKGELKAAGEPLAGATISVAERARAGGPALRSAIVHSDERGRFAYLSPTGPSRSVTFHYAGSKLIRPAAERFELRVAARTSIAVTPRAVSNGRAVAFSGRLKGGFVPRAGKLLGLEAHYRGRWRAFATPRTAADGSWRYRYRFGATAGSVLYSFRARIPFELAYPFEAAVSKKVLVRVRG